MALCTYLEEVKKKTEELSKKELFLHFKKLLQVGIKPQCYYQVVWVFFNVALL